MVSKCILTPQGITERGTGHCNRAQDTKLPPNPLKGELEIAAAIFTIDY